MKTTKILCLILACLMIVPVFASCGAKKAAATVSIVFRVPTGEKDEDGNDKYEEKFSQPSFTVEGTTDDKFTVLFAVEQAFKKFEVQYELSDDGTYIASAFDHKQTSTYDDENGYYDYWECTINGEQSKNGRQSETLIYDQSEIVFTWTSGKQPIKTTTAAVTTDPNAETTAEIPKDETTVVETTKEVA